MGAHVRILDQTAIIDGVEELFGAPVTCTDLRAGAALVVAGLMAKGTTEIFEPSFIARGYEHIEEKLTLKQIAQHVHLSEEYTSRIFKKETGIHLTNYINKQKCLQAKRMITTGTHSLREISVKLGFENYDYFSKSFKKHIGTVPSKIKKNSMID